MTARIFGRVSGEYNRFVLECDKQGQGRVLSPRVRPCHRHHDDGRPGLPAERSEEPCNHRRTDVMVTALLMVATVWSCRESVL
ncbi:hypothetical protein KOW79_018554 [Hemibagrus wyckioides]|uniref:Uncharacterized protein n=1 Tax=Hemibagrus wyckioides TaxID=337641 RepID=A0A9D3NA13_9TELE|nr:hypothetical protein KOW79_018554 [Hemibagrus wyckioides]